jgi:hypothetical protein
MVLELIICCFLVFAAGYWVTLWTAGRRADVLHGQFVEAQPETNPPVNFATATPAAVPPVVFPKKPAVVAAPPPLPVQPASTDQLQSLLTSIKRELKNAAQI